MRIYIHDKCMEQLFELPKTIQKKVLEFQKKFRDNSKSEAIHLEPITTFKDPHLRTARIDGKYRAIVKVPQTGDDYYLLWVDNHDEAMDWAKNKVFHWNENTQTAQLFTALTENIIEHKIIANNASNFLFVDYSEQQLIALGVPDQLIELVHKITDLNQLEDLEQYLPVDVYERLFYLSDGVPYASLLAEIEDGKSKSENLIDQVASNNNKRSFIEVNDDLMNEIINGELSKWQLFLHPSQRKLVESSFKGPVKVTGGAGTGKTVVALHRLHFLAGLPDTENSKPIAFVTFTNSLTENINRLAQKLSVDMTKVTIRTIDSLARELASTYGLTSKGIRILDTYNSKNSVELWEDVLEQTLSAFDSSFLSTEYQSVKLFNNLQTKEDYLNTSRIGRGKPITRKQRIDVWKLFEQYEQKKQEECYLDRLELFNLVCSYLQDKDKPFKQLIADEIQDFSNVELRFLRSLVAEKPNDLFLVGDPYQKIYARKINFTTAGISVRGNRSKQLRINYRTSEEIKRLAVSAIQGISYDDFDGEAEKLKGYHSLFHGEKPVYESFKSKEEELAFLVETIKTVRGRGYKYNDIAVGTRTREAMREIKTHLHKQKIPYQDNSTQDSSQSDSVVLSTFHNLKGLEFKAVLLAEVNNRTAPLYFQKIEQMTPLEREEYQQSEKSLLYVAMTRAISILKIMGTGTKTDLIGI
jgi:mRNA-degrading endonuclease RelE of RelBE toxin-antitoxin system